MENQPQLSREEKLQIAKQKLKNFRECQNHQTENFPISSIQHGISGNGLQCENPSNENGSSGTVRTTLPGEPNGESFPNCTQFYTANLPYKQKLPLNMESTTVRPSAVIEKVAQISQHLNHLSGSAASEVASEPTSDAPDFTLDSVVSPYQIHQHPSDHIVYQTQTPFSSNKTSTSHLSLPTTWHANSRPPPSASSILIRELQQRNVELAAILQQRNETHDNSVAQVAVVREQLQRLRRSADEDRANQERSTQRELTRARDQIRAHSQTVGALVAEKTELEAKLAHLERLGESRCRELQQARGQISESAARLRVLEDQLRLTTSASEHSEVSKGEALRQLEVWRSEAKKEKNARASLEGTLRGRVDRIAALEAELMNLKRSNEDMARQLEVATAFSPATNTTTLATVTASTPCRQCEALRGRIHDLECSGVHTMSEKGHLENRYRAYVSDMERRLKLLQVDLDGATGEKERLQSTVDDLRHQATGLESELTRVVSELEQIRNQQTINEAAIVKSTPLLEVPTSTADTLPPTAEVGPEIILASEAYKKLQETVDILKRKVNDVTDRLSEAQEAASVAECRLADRDAVLAQSLSERTALSRAMEQNSRLKEQIAVAMKNKVTAETQTLENVDAYMKYQEPKRYSTAQCASVQTDVALLPITHHVGSVETSAAIEVENMRLRELSSRQEEELHAYRNRVVDSIPRAIQQSSTAVMTEEQRYRVEKRDVMTEAFCQTECSLVKSEETLASLRLQLSEATTNYTQLEGAFNSMAGRVVALDEEKSHLESLVAQLEMESSTVGEYVTLFAHRRQAQLKRARIREALLSRIVRDRGELRQRLSALSILANDIISNIGAATSGDGKPASSEDHPSLRALGQELTDFLSDLDTSSIDYLHDNNDDDDEVYDLGHRPMKNDSSVSPKPDGTTKLNDQLQLLSIPMHDCPHCECCSGSLLVV